MRIMRLVLLSLLVVGLTAVTVIDADGDPATGNLPLITLGSESAVPSEAAVHLNGMDPGDSSGTAPPGPSATHHRLVAALAQRLRRLHFRRAPIRGP